MPDSSLCHGLASSEPGPQQIPEQKADKIQRRPMNVQLVPVMELFFIPCEWSDLSPPNTIYFHYLFILKFHERKQNDHDVKFRAAR